MYSKTYYALQVNFYERTIELMKQNMEVERKEIAQGFKMEISGLEEQKALAEEQFKQLRRSVERLEGELKNKSEFVAWGPEQERRVQREQAELEQNYAREIGNIVHRLTSEKDQLEAELKLKMDQEVLLVRWVYPDVLWSQYLQVNLKKCRNGIFYNGIIVSLTATEMIQYGITLCLLKKEKKNQ